MRQAVRSFITAALFVGIASPALAGAPGGCNAYPITPPAHYLAEGERLLAEGRVRVHDVPWVEIHQACSFEPTMPGGSIRECARPAADGTWDVWVTRMADLCHYSQYAALLDHGLAHAGGWPAHHPR